MRRSVTTVLVTGATLAGIGAVLVLDRPSDPATPSTSTSTASATTDTSTTSSGTAPTTTVAATVTGDAYASPYGPMQVAVTVTDGQITDVEWLALPTDHHSVRINDYAAPLLVEQALAAQSAEVDGVSGATYTTEGFRISLESAIREAGL